MRRNLRCITLHSLSFSSLNRATVARRSTRIVRVSLTIRAIALIKGPERVTLGSVRHGWTTIQTVAKVLTS